LDDKTPAVVTPLDEHMGLDISRSLGRRGIPVYGLEADRSAPGRHSKYCRFVQCPDPEVDNGAPYLQFMIDFGKKLGRRAVLYPLSDKHVLICSREREALDKYYEFVMPDHQTVLDLTTKNGLTTIAEKYNIPAPRTIFLGPENHIDAAIEQVTFPVILKPTESTYWHSPEITSILHSGVWGGRAKVILCQTRDELLKAYHLIAAHDDRLIVQEVIPGEDSRLVYFSFYFNRQSQPLGIFAGRKHRVIPTGFGSASFVRSLYDEQLKEIAFKLLFSVGYKGLGGVEFKKDPRDEQYKLVEFNSRFGMWDGLGAKCGVDLAYIAYRDAINQPLEPVFSYRENIIWFDWERDIRALIEYRRKGQLTVGQWLQSLKGEKMFGVYAGDDWGVNFAYTAWMLGKFVGRLAGK
jgi:D-aspartate ligase